MKDKFATLKDARRHIREAIAQNNPYSHNIVSLSLCIVEKRYGRKAANQLVREFRNPYGIQEERTRTSKYPDGKKR